MEENSDPHEMPITRPLTPGNIGFDPEAFLTVSKDLRALETRLTNDLVKNPIDISKEDLVTLALDLVYAISLFDILALEDVDYKIDQETVINRSVDRLRSSALLNWYRITGRIGDINMNVLIDLLKEDFYLGQRSWEAFRKQQDELEELGKDRHPEEEEEYLALVEIRRILIDKLLEYFPELK